MNDLTRAELKLIERGRCIECEGELPRTADDPRDYSKPPEERRKVVAQGRTTCSDKCRARRYRKRRKAGKVRTQAQRSHARAEQELERLLLERGDLVRQLAELIERARELGVEIVAHTSRTGLQPPKLPWANLEVPALELVPQGEALRREALELERKGQTAIPGASAGNTGNVSPGAKRKREVPDLLEGQRDKAGRVADPVWVEAVREALEEGGELTELEIAARTRLTLEPVRRCLAVLGNAGKVKPKTSACRLAVGGKASRTVWTLQNAG